MITKYFHTIKYLKSTQIFYRIWYKAFSPKPKIKIAPPLREMGGFFSKPIEKKRTFFDDFEFFLLNQARKIEKPEDWNEGFDKLWLYNLHYFDDLGAGDSKNRLGKQKQLIEKWIRENPLGEGIGWEPYPISLRVVNWIKWHIFYERLEDQEIQNLAMQIRYLEKNLEYHILGNHLMANAKCLIFGGCFFAGEEGNKWLKKGLRILFKQLKEQTLSDGGHFERSPMYHNLILEDLLDIKNLFQSYRINHSKQLDFYIKKMFMWSQIMKHPDGDLPFFNDAAIGIAHKPEEIKKYYHRLGYDQKPPEDCLSEFPESGYVKAKKGNITLFMDIGEVGPDYLPGHAHADTLSFEVSYKKNRVFVNSGTSIYQPGKKREHQRSTRAHNCLEINDQNSSEVWNSFRVARRARIKEKDVLKFDNKVKVYGVHDGYKRLKGIQTHKREWLVDDKTIKIIEKVQGSCKSRIKIHFHFHPQITVKKVEGDGDSFFLFLANEKIGKIYFTESAQVSLIGSNYYPEFGKAIENTKLIVSLENADLPFEFKTLIEFKE